MRRRLSDPHPSDGRPKLKAVFFDAGQTLVHPDPPVEVVYASAFAAFDVNASVVEVGRAFRVAWREVVASRQRGDGRWDGEDVFWRRFVQLVYQQVGGGALPDACLERLVAHFQDERHWAVYPEVREVLSELRSRGLRTLIVSNWDASLPGLLERLALASLFDDVVVSALVGAAKPSPTIFTEALKRAGVTAGEALHVGDSLVEDYDGARAAGLSALLLDRAGVGGAGERIDTLLALLPRVAEA